MGVVSCLSVIRGIFEYSLEACSLSAVWNQEGPLVGGCFNISSIVISIRVIASVLYTEVVLWWEGPLWEVPL